MAVAHHEAAGEADDVDAVGVRGVERGIAFRSANAEALEAHVLGQGPDRRAKARTPLDFNVAEDRIARGVDDEDGMPVDRVAVEDAVPDAETAQRGGVRCPHANALRADDLVVEADDSRKHAALPVGKKLRAHVPVVVGLDRVVRHALLVEGVGAVDVLAPGDREPRVDLGLVGALKWAVGD